MTCVTINVTTRHYKKSYMRCPTAPSDLTLSDLGSPSQNHSLCIIKAICYY